MFPEEILKEAHRDDRGRDGAGARTRATGWDNPACVPAERGSGRNKACRGLIKKSSSATLSFMKEKGKRKVAALKEGVQFSQM